MERGATRLLGPCGAGRIVVHSFQGLSWRRPHDFDEWDPLEWLLVWALFFMDAPTGASPMKRRPCSTSDLLPALDICQHHQLFIPYSQLNSTAHLSFSLSSPKWTLCLPWNSMRLEARLVTLPHGGTTRKYYAATAPVVPADTAGGPRRAGSRTVLPVTGRNDLNA